MVARTIHMAHLHWPQIFTLVACFFSFFLKKKINEKKKNNNIQVYGVRFVHKQGGVTCDILLNYTLTNWGCGFSKWVGMQITDTSNNLLIPPSDSVSAAALIQGYTYISEGGYEIDGFNSTSPYYDINFKGGQYRIYTQGYCFLHVRHTLWLYFFQC